MDATQPQQEPGAEALLVRLAAVAVAAAARSKTWRQAARLAGRFGRVEDLRDVAAVRKAAKGLGKLDLDAARDLAEALRSHARVEARERRFRLAREVTEAFVAAGEEPRPLGGEPPVLRVGPVVVTLDWGRDKAIVTYARVPVAEAPLVPDRVVEAWSEAVAGLREGARSPEEVRELLLGAYRAHLARAGLKPGDRVAAVDLLPLVALAVQPDAFLADPRRKAFAEYGRARFAWDLAALVRAGLLSAGGLRLEIGPATMGATADKRRVLWLEVGSSGGQYYGSLRFVPAGGGER